MGFDAGREFFSELVKCLESAFQPAHYEIAVEKLVAREKQYILALEDSKRDCDRMKAKVEKFSTVDSVLNLETATQWEEERKQLNDRIAELTLAKKRVDDENATWRRDVEKLKERITRLEEAMSEIKEDNRVPSLQTVKWRVWDDFVFVTPNRASTPAAAKANGEGTSLEIIDCDDDYPAMVGDRTAINSSPNKVTGCNSSFETNKANTTSLKRNLSSVIDLYDDDNESTMRKSRKLGACSSAREANESLVEIVVIDKCQEVSSTERTSSEKDAMAATSVNGRSSCSRRQRLQEMKIKRWNFDVEMLADFSNDDELCMRAVCALYRHQRRKGSSLTIFSQQRETSLVKFLTNGDPEGRLKRSVSELQQFCNDSVKHCRDIACAHFTDLFHIYQKKEDPFFPHS